MKDKRAASISDGRGEADTATRGKRAVGLAWSMPFGCFCIFRSLTLSGDAEGSGSISHLRRANALT
jgi:hypothetical protein